MNKEKPIKKYVVVKVTTEYNDEYYIVEDGYTLSSKIFSSREKAQEELDRQVKGLFMDGDTLDPSLFNFSYYDLFDNADLVSYIEKLYENAPDQEYNEYDDLVLPDSATLEQCLEAYRLSGLNLFKIVEVEEDTDSSNK